MRGLGWLVVWAIAQGAKWFIRLAIFSIIYVGVLIWARS